MSALSPFGRQVRQWRKRRGFSQLDLALQAETTPRHLSFLETGRSRPSGTMVARLAQALEVPLRERNALFEAAGLPPRYSQGDISQAELAPFQAAIRRLLDQQMPYPAWVVDRHWRMVDRNTVSAALFPVEIGDCVVDAFLGPLRQGLANFPEVAWESVERLRREAQATDDTVLHELVERAESLLVDVPRPKMVGRADVVVCPILQVGDQQVHTISMMARFGAPQDVTLSELRVELMFPRDDAADQFFRGLRVG